MNLRSILVVHTLCVIIFINACEPRTDRNNIIAKVGDLTISVSEFEQHFQYNPYLTKFKNPILAKREILATLIAQKLLAQANQSPSQLVSEYTKQFNREAIIESLWDEKIASDISISETDVFELYRKSKTKKIIRYLVFENEDSAIRASEYISENDSFEKYAELAGFANEAIPSDTIVAGKSIRVLEDFVYSRELGHISGPIKIGKSFFIINILSEITEIFTDENDFQNQYRRLEKTLKQRSKQKSFLNFIKEKYPRSPYSIDRKIFKQLAQYIELQIDFTQSSNSNSSINLPFKDEIDLADLDNTPIINFENGPTWTCRHLMQRLQVSPYPLDLRSPGFFRKSIIAATKNIMDDEILVFEGKKIGLENSLYVIDQSAMWRDHIYKTDYLASGAIRTGTLDSVLVNLLEESPVEIEYGKLKATSNERTNMMVFKTHFPLRTIVPDLMLTDKLPNFRKNIFKTIKE